MCSLGGKNEEACSVVIICLIVCDDERLWSTLWETNLYFSLTAFFLTFLLGLTLDAQGRYWTCF
jgi:hypothetical protein